MLATRALSRLLQAFVEPATLYGDLLFDLRTALQAVRAVLGLEGP